MFLDIDYNKKNLKANYYLAKPNKQVISVIHESMNDSLKLELGGISEVNLTIPYKIINPKNEEETIDNPHVEKIKEKMLIKMVIGNSIEWFIVHELDESSSAEEFTITCYALPYELKSKLIGDMEVTEPQTLKSLAMEILASSIWSIGFVDDKFNQIYRTYSESKTNALDCVIKLAETFGALLIWDTNARKINFYDPDTYGEFRGLVLNNRLLEDAKISRTSEQQMITKLYAYGADNITFSDVNPTGNPYLEDYSYYLYPFEQDSSGRVIRSSYYMSDELCKAILAYNKLIEQNNHTLMDYIEDITNKVIEVTLKDTALNQLKLELESILNRLDAAKASDSSQKTIDAITDEETAKRFDISQMELIMNSLQTELTNTQAAYDSLKEVIGKEANFTPALLDELNIYEIEETFEDSDIVDPVDLYNEARIKFESLKRPNKVVSVSTINLFNVVEEQFYWDKIVIGDWARIKDRTLKLDYKSILIAVEYDFETGEAALSFSDDPNIIHEKSKLQEILYDAQNTSTIVNDNRFRWNEINMVSQNVSELISGAWDANKQQISAGLNNSIDIGKRGIVITNPDRQDEVIIMQSGIVALSKDKGTTWTTAMTPSGVNAETIMGRLLIGESLVITSEGNTFQLDANGARFDANHFEVTSSSGKNKVDDWDYTVSAIEQAYDDNVITPYEKKMLKVEWGEILTKYNGLVERATSFYYPDAGSLYELNQYEEKYANLYNYLFVSPQGSNKAILDSTNLKEAAMIKRTEYQTAFDEFYQAQEKLTNLLSQRAKELIDLNQKALRDIQDDVKNVLDDVPYWIELTSTRGTMFSNSNIETQLVAKLYKGGNEVTAKLPRDSFKWSKRDKDGVQDTVWNKAHTNAGNIISINREDVYRKAIFRCEIWFDSDLIAT